MATVETRAIRKIFQEHTAVDGVDLQTREGEFLVLLGPSGCGKTTLLRMIAGLEHQTSGDILIGGRVVNDLPPRERKIAMVFQSYALYPHMTVAKNIAFPLKAQGADPKTIDDRVRTAAAMFGIERLLQRKPRQLSGGERQRVALARAMVREPDVFLLDEPLSNLDAKLRHMARDELQQFQRRLKTTTVYVIWKFAANIAGAKKFLVDYIGNFHRGFEASEFYNFPCFQKTVPDLKQLLQKDSKGKPPDKYAVLADSLDWATNVGYPGYANAAIDDIYSNWIVNNMFAKAAQGVMSPEDAVKEAEAKCRDIFAKWKERKLL